jgi:Trypsin-co-occurring domain 2
MAVKGSPELMGLSAALEGLREELESAWEKGAGKAIRFGVGEVTLTLEAVARRDVDGSGKIRWWLIEAGGGVTAGKETTQTLVLKLTPGLYDAQGNARPLDVAGDQQQPGG